MFNKIETKPTKPIGPCHFFLPKIATQWNCPKKSGPPTGSPKVPKLSKRNRSKIPWANCCGKAPNLNPKHRRYRSDSPNGWEKDAIKQTLKVLHTNMLEDFGRNTSALAMNSLNKKMSIHAMLSFQAMEWTQWNLQLPQSNDVLDLQVGNSLRKDMILSWRWIPG